jgi:hypothetical protein
MAFFLVARCAVLLQRENVRAFYARIPAQFGVLNPDAGD